MTETSDTTIQVEDLQNLQVREAENGYSVSLVDNDGYEIVRGFGETITEALNDLHSNLI